MTVYGARHRRQDKRPRRRVDLKSGGRHCNEEQKQKQFKNVCRHARWVTSDRSSVSESLCAEERCQVKRVSGLVSTSTTVWHGHVQVQLCNPPRACLEPSGAEACRRMTVREPVTLEALSCASVPAACAATMEERRMFWDAH